MEAVKSGDKKRVLPAWMTTQETPKPKRAVQGAAAARWGNFWLGTWGNRRRGGFVGIILAGAEPSGAGGAGGGGCSRVPGPSCLHRVLVQLPSQASGVSSQAALPFWLMHSSQTLRHQLSKMPVSSFAVSIVTVKWSSSVDQGPVCLQEDQEQMSSSRWSSMKSAE